MTSSNVPAEQPAVERGGGLGVGLRGVDPARDAGDVAVLLAHRCSSRSGRSDRSATDDLGQDLSSISATMNVAWANAAGRLLDLLSLLQARRDWPGATLAERLGVSGRTIRRDVERLRELGYPVESVTGPAGGYRLGAGTAMPPLLLDEEEAIAIAVGLRTAARASVTGIEETSIRALVKLEQVLPAHLRRRVAALGSATIAAPRRRPDRRPAAPDDDRRRLPRHRAPAVRATAAATAPRPAATSSRTRWSTSGGAGTSSPGTAAARTGARSASTASAGPPPTGARFTPRTLPAADAAAYVEQSIAGGAQPLRGARHGARAGGRGRGAGCRGWRARSRRSTPSAASTGRRTTTSSGSRCGS